MDKYDEGVQIFESLLGTFPYAGPSWVWSGLLLAMSRSGSGDDAIYRFEKAIDEGQLDWSADLAQTILEIYKSKGLYDRAVRRFETLVHYQPLNMWSWHVLADSYYASGQETLALDAYRRAIQINKAEFMVYHRLCRIYYGASDYQNVVHCYDIVMQMCPKSVLWEYAIVAGLTKPEDWIAWQSVRTRSFSSAIWHPKIDINNTLLSLFLWNPAAKSYEALGLHEEAIAIYKEVLTYYESVKDADSNSIIVIYPENYWKGYRIYRRKRCLPRPVLWYLIGELHSALKQFKRSLEAFQKALAALPDNIWLQEVINATQRETEVNDANVIDLDTNDKVEPIEASTHPSIDRTLETVFA